MSTLLLGSAGYHYGRLLITGSNGCGVTTTDDGIVIHKQNVKVEGLKGFNAKFERSIETTSSTESKKVTS